MCYNLLGSDLYLSKINIKSVLKSQKETVKYEGKGIKNKNRIVFNEKAVKTAIDIKNKIIIERKEEYYLKIVFSKQKKEEGKYITKYGNLKIETYTKELKIEENKFKIKYDLIINEHFIDTFEYNFEYSIDS